eukprot:TRINITY_DN1_c0_g1_i1.p3 TRINITY_DN1_c0_g1~~TRINITY_DN1_c0_g1_i1.p3  ORF type:complete len:112 (-),score=11.85 TRINITY_DN1_c0_g1_i1:438-773(-)
MEPNVFIDESEQTDSAAECNRLIEPRQDLEGVFFICTDVVQELCLAGVLKRQLRIIHQMWQNMTSSDKPAYWGRKCLVKQQIKVSIPVKSMKEATTELSASNNGSSKWIEC